MVDEYPAQSFSYTSQFSARFSDILMYAYAFAPLALLPSPINNQKSCRHNGMMRPRVCDLMVANLVAGGARLAVQRVLAVPHCLPACSRVIGDTFFMIMPSIYMSCFTNTNNGERQIVGKRGTLFWLRKRRLLAKGRSATARGPRFECAILPSLVSQT
jgi:hypothetical protein